MWRTTSALFPAVLSGFTLTVALVTGFLEPAYATDSFERGFLSIVVALLLAFTAFWTIVWWRWRRRERMARLPGFPVIQAQRSGDA
jgi:membrane protein DedA with SNARE-associated domain